MPGPVTLLAGGFWGVACQVRGDWQFMSEAFGFPHWNRADHMCWMCRASGSKNDRYFGDCRVTAGWRRTLFSHESFLEHLHSLGKAIPILMDRTIGLRLDNFMVDTLHCIDLGVAAHVVGNVFFIFCIMRRVLGGRNQEQCIGHLESHIRAWCKRTKSTG